MRAPLLEREHLKSYTPGGRHRMGREEQLRRLLAVTTVDAAQRERAAFDRYVALAAMPETTQLQKTIDAWWAAIATFIRTRGDQRQDRSRECANQELQTHRPQYRSRDNFKCRVTLYNAARMAV